MEKITEDVKTFGKNVFVYCNQHLYPHLTGWCTVDSHHKTLLEATTVEDAYRECVSKEFPIFDGYI